MSAIWGFIRLDKDQNELQKRIEECRGKMKQPYEECVIDRFEDTVFDNGFFACGVQEFNERSKEEKLPVLDRENGFVFTADVILNDRDRLVKDINEHVEELANGGLDLAKDFMSLPDGQLAYFAWLIWKKDFIRHITGMFAIAVYDFNNAKFYLFADHMGTRCINYYAKDGVILFSTLSRPITAVMPEKEYGINERFIAACESTASPELCLFAGETPFENVYQVNAGCYIENQIDDNGNFISRELEYWNPLKENKKETGTEIKDYRQLFRDCFFNCVKDAIDTDGNVAATISSGLDSTSVAGIAARILKKKDEKLYGFTSVPLSDYDGKLERGMVADESNGVKNFLSAYDNIDHFFDDCEGKSAFTELERLVHIIEAPVKALSNLVWIEDIAQKAKEKKCKVLLIGQFGNGTISSGDVLSRVYQEIREGHFATAKKQLAKLGEKFGISRKNLIGIMASQWFEKASFDLGLNRSFKKSFDNVYLKEELLKKHNIVDAHRKQFKRQGYNSLATRKQQLSFVFDKAMAQNINMYDTRLSLYTGIMIKDPTRDKRLVELIASFPIEQFCDNAVERRLVREYLSDIVPDSVRLDYNHMGRQSADMGHRLKKYGNKPLFKEFCGNLSQYMQMENVKSLFERQEIDDDNGFDLVRIAALDVFLKENYK